LSGEKPVIFQSPKNHLAASQQLQRTNSTKDIIFRVFRG
jgi:hypothetical protein